MAMVLEAVVDKLVALLANFVHEEVIMLLGVKDELQKLRQRMRSIQCLLRDAEKKKFGDSSIQLWLSELKDVMYDAEDIIDLCRIKGTQLSSVCYDLSSAFSCFASVPSRHKIGKKIKHINDRLNQIYEDNKRYKLEKSTISETPQITLADSRQTSSMDDPFVVGREVEVEANHLVYRLVGEKVDEKCRLFTVTGMGGIGKTTLAQKIFNHPIIQSYFNLKVWVCVSKTYLGTELLKQVIRGAKGNYGDANTKAELEPILRDSIASGQSLFLVLDDVWESDVWVNLFRVPLNNSNRSVRILITTRDENVAKEMQAAYIHPVMHLSVESSWDMLRRRLFSEEEEELANGLKEIGLKIVNKCKGLPLAIKVIAGVLARKECTRNVWENFLENDSWSINELPEELRGSLYLSFEDLPSHLKQCFLYFSLYREDEMLFSFDVAPLWVAEGFVIEGKNVLMEDSAEECFNELVKRNLLVCSNYKMHDLIRFLTIFLSKEETSFGALNVRNSTASIKLRRLSIAHQKAAVEVLNSVADQGALRTLLASWSDLLLDDERLRQLSHLRVLDISYTQIQILPGSIGKLLHLRYLNLNHTNIRAIPESIEQLTNLQFLYISSCENLGQLPSGITRLYNLRHLNILKTPVNFIPKGIEKLEQLNHLSGFVMANNDSSSKLEALNSLQQMRTLYICNLKRPQSETIILKELPNLSTLTLEFIVDSLVPSEEQELAVEELFDKITPPQSLKTFKVLGFFGRRFPNWMVLSSFKNLIILKISDVKSCIQLPPLGQLPMLKVLTIKGAYKVKKIGLEFLGGDVNLTTRIAFPKLLILNISYMDLLEEWSFDAHVMGNASPCPILMPCLNELNIKCCPLLKQLPKDLKYTAMKSLHIENATSLKSLDNLPTELENLKIVFCVNLERLGCIPTLKKLVIDGCSAFSCMEKLDSLKELFFHDIINESLPDCLLTLLRQRRLQIDTNDDFLLDLYCDEKVLQGCLREGIYWDLIQNIPRVNVSDFYFHYLRYRKQPYVYDTNT